MSAHLVHEHSCLASSLPNLERHTNLSHSSRSLALDDISAVVLISAVVEALNRPADRCLAHLHSTYSEAKLAPLPVCNPWPSFEVFLKQPHGSLGATRPPCRESCSL
jgi:hypothetical protein